MQGRRGSSLGSDSCSEGVAKQQLVQQQQRELQRLLAVDAADVALVVLDEALRARGLAATRGGERGTERKV